MSNNYLLYDGECPACHSYIAIAQLHELWLGLRIINTREAPEIVRELRAKGFEINEGIVLHLCGNTYFGAEATRIIGTAGRKHGGPRALMLRAVGDAPWSRWLYPWLNRGRQLLLAALGRTLMR